MAKGGAFPTEDPGMLKGEFSDCPPVAMFPAALHQLPLLQILLLALPLLLTARLGAFAPINSKLSPTASLRERRSAASVWWDRFNCVWEKLGLILSIACIYVCICVCMCVYIYVCVCIYVYIYVYVYVCVYMYIYVYIFSLFIISLII